LCYYKGLRAQII